MFVRAVSASMLIGLALASPVAAQVNLQWKFKQGDSFYVEEKMNSKTTTMVMGINSTEEQAIHKVSKFVVKSSSDKGTVMEQRVESWKSKTSGGPGGDRDESEKLDKLFKDLVFTFHLAPNGSVTKFEGYEEFVKRTDTLDAEEGKVLRAILGEEALRSPVNAVFAILPPKEVKKGQTWNHDNIVPMGPMGTFKLATTFTYDGPGSDGEQIGSKASITFQPPRGGIDLGFKLVKVDLTKNEAKGKLIFDNAKGRLVSHELSMPMAGTMVVEVAGMQVEVQLDATETRTLRMTTERPK